jgi:cystathionine beta-synthase
VSDRDSVATTLYLAREEGILTGGSGGMAVAAARTVAVDCAPGDVVVVLLPDSGRGYLSKIFNDDWLRRFGFADRTDDGPLVGDVVAGADLPVVAPDRTVAGALAILRATGARYLPVAAAPSPVRLAEIVGTVAEPALAALADGGRGADPVAAHLAPALPPVGRGQSLAEVVDTLTGTGAALVLDGGLPTAVITATELMAAFLQPSHPGVTATSARDGETR